ncbi:S-layer homology domain-containing protein [Clostridium phoceensis]|uniref:S-layer homology domain-containing protein n=1 Tax=Clostridium phoceensis TaxID=1650661 RepID=UPI002E775004|nr:S-layer homology domain-containing protein [Clostridium phoceensis]
MKKRLLAIVMTMAMALSLLPVTALADGADTGSQPAGQVQEDPDLGNTGGGGDDPLPGDGPNEGDDPTLPGGGPDEGNDPTLPGDGPDEGNDPTLPGDGPDAGDAPSLPGDENPVVLPTDDTQLYAGAAKVAVIGTTEYETLDAALSAAENDDTITLTDNAEISFSFPEGVKTLTIDLGKNTLTLTNNTSILLADGKSLTIQNGNLVSKPLENPTVTAFNIQSGSSIKLDNVTYDCTGSALYPQGNAAKVTVIDSTITADVYAVATNAGQTDNYDVVIDLKDSTFQARLPSELSKGDSCPVMINIPGKLTMDSCTVIGGRQGVLVRGGTAKISNTDIQLNATYIDGKDKYLDGNWGSGNEVPMAALVVGNRSNAYNYPTDCTLSNVTVTATSGYTGTYIYGMSDEGREVTFNYDASTELGTLVTEGEVSTDNVEGSIGSYATISEALKAGETSVKLLHDLSEDVVISENSTLTLDLNGQTLTNVSSHTIVNQGALTILDSAGGGVVDVVTHGKAALYNYGTITEISGGMFTRSKETQYPVSGGTAANSWYTVVNGGVIEEISGGTFTTGDGTSKALGNLSSVIRNGVDDSADPHPGEIKLISGGTFTGAANVLKNEPNGKIGTITGGTFTMDNQEQHFWGGNNVLQNYGTIDSITGGAFRAIGSSDDGYLIAGQPNPAARYGITNYGMIGEMGGDVSVSVAGNSRAVYVAYSSSVGGTSSLNITGGTYAVTPAEGTEQNTFPPAVIMANSAQAALNISGGSFQGDIQTGTAHGLSISGGYFTADPTSYLVSGKDAVASNQDGYQYMVGTLALSQQTLALTKGGEAVLSVNAEPWGAVPASAVSWSSDNEAVAAVDNGTVTAAAPGTATITAEVNGKSLTCSVTVSYAGVDGISLDRSALTLVSGGSTALTATVSPSNADQTVTWTSSDEAVATVAQDGTVTAVAAGEAIITASAGAYRASCTVTVTGADVDVLPSTEPTETEDQLPDGLNDEVKEAVNEAAGTVNAGSALSQAAQEQAGQLANSAEKDELLQKGQSELGSEEIVLYTQTYLQVTTVDALTGTDGSINSVTLDISPKGQVVASTASTAGDINQGNSVVVKEIPQEDLNITGTAHVTLTLPDDFASKTIYIKHQASNGRTYFYTAEADEGANLTFSTRHGFSPFTFSLTNEAAAQVGDVGYADLQDAIDAVADGGTITVMKDGLGTVTIQGSKTFTLVKGEDVDTLPTLVAASGYRLTDHGNGSYTISRRSSGGGSSGSATYTVSVDSSRHGDVTVSPKSASKGTTVTITVKPDDGYELDELTVTDKDGDSIKLKDKGDGRFTFTMPASKVTVEAVFTALEQEEEQPLFSDVAEDDWYYDAVAYVAENGIMSGTDGSRFSPNGTLTRAMLSQILYAMEDKPAVSGAATFSDVAAGAWYADAVNWTAAQGIVAGMGENSFAPDAPVTREQLSLILYGYARYKGYDTSASVSLSGYADRDSVAVWAADSMGWAVSEGLISGRPGGYLDPAGTATRAEVAQILMNFCEDLAR